MMMVSKIFFAGLHSYCANALTVFFEGGDRSSGSASRMPF